MDPDPAIFVIELQDASNKLIFNTIFLLITFEGTFTSFVKDKKSKRFTIEGIKFFLTIFA
jgi:hypothetical protein